MPKLIPVLVTGMQSGEADPGICGWCDTLADMVMMLPKMDKHTPSLFPYGKPCARKAPLVSLHTAAVCRNHHDPQPAAGAGSARRARGELPACDGARPWAAVWGRQRCLPGPGIAPDICQPWSSAAWGHAGSRATRVPHTGMLLAKFGCRSSDRVPGEHLKELIWGKKAARAGLRLSLPASGVV